MTDSVITNDDFEHIDHPGEDFEAVESRPLATDQDHQDGLSLVASMVEFDTVSDGGETVETVSACGQSDAETVASVGSDSDEPQDNRSGRLRFPDPLPTPADEIDRIPERTIPTLPQSVLDKFKSAEPSKTDDEDEWAAVRASEVTIRGAEEKENPTASSSIEMPKSQGSEPFSGSLDAENRVGTKQSSEKKTKRSVSSLIPDSLRFRSSTAIWAIGVLALAIQGSLFFHSNGWNSTDPYTESVHRLRDLKLALVSRGIAKPAIADGLASHVLVYPWTYPGPTEDAHLAFPSEISMNVANGQVFISLPREHRGKYPTSPEVEVRNGKCGTQEKDCDIPILEQVDLIDGITYIRLDVPSNLEFFDITVKTPQHSTVVSFKYMRGSQDQHHQLQSAIRVKDVLSRSLRDIVASAKIATGNIEQSLLDFMDRSVRAKDDLFGGLSKPMSDLSANAKLMMSDGNRRAHQLAQATRTNWDKNRAELRTLAGLQIKKLDSASKMVLSKLGIASKQVEATLARAQKNGIGIAHRIAKSLRS